MAWRMRGSYVGNCSCRLICPCAVDGQPTGPDGTCRGVTVWHIDEGDMDGTDLSGLSYGLYYHLDANFGAGNAKIGVVVDDAASEDQFKALAMILGGDAGGPFADMAPLIGEVDGPHRAAITYSDGDTPRATVDGRGDLAFEPLLGPDGTTPTTIRNAMFGFAPEFRVGKGTGTTTGFKGETFETVYGEAAEFEYSSEMSPEEGRPRV